MQSTEEENSASFHIQLFIPVLHSLGYCTDVLDKSLVVTSSSSMDVRFREILWKSLVNLWRLEGIGGSKLESASSDLRFYHLCWLRTCWASSVAHMRLNFYSAPRNSQYCVDNKVLKFFRLSRLILGRARSPPEFSKTRYKNILRSGSLLHYKDPSMWLIGHWML